MQRMRMDIIAILAIHNTYIHTQYTIQEQEWECQRKIYIAI